MKNFIIQRSLLLTFACASFGLSNMANSSEQNTDSVNSTQHEIEYGIIDLNNGFFIDMDFSEYPIIGATYRYYYEPLDNVEAPYAIAADVGRVSWTSVTANLFLGLPSIDGQYYINEEWDLEYTLLYDEEERTDFSSTYRERELFIDLAANKQIDEHWQIGFGVRHFAENSESKSEIDDLFDYEFTDSESSVVVQSRYRKLIEKQGWDVKMSLSSSEAMNTFKLQSTYYTSYNNGVTYGLVHVSDKDTSDDVTVISFGHEYWFSESASIDYGFGTSLGDGSGFLIDINGKWRF